MTMHAHARPCMPMHDHAAHAGGVYADYSSAMGYCCATRCMNPPNNWQLGWGDLVAGSGGGLEPGVPRTLVLPLQGTAAAHVVRLRARGRGVVCLGGREAVCLCVCKSEEGGMRGVGGRAGFRGG